MILGLTGCQSLTIVPTQSKEINPSLVVDWITPTIDGEFKIHRKMTRMSPLLTSDLVFQSNNIDSIVAIKRSSGKILWSRKFKGGVEAGAELFRDLLFVAANDGTVTALKATSGDVVWTFSSSSENVSVPVLDPSSGLLYFQNSQNILFCLEADSGRQVWVFSRPDNSLMTIRGSSSPVLRDGVVFAGFSEGSFVALRGANGQLIWEQTLNRNKKFRDIDARAVVSGSQIFIAGYDDKLYSLRADNGQILWSYPSGSYSAVSLDKSHLYLSTTNSEVIKLTQESGELVWKFTAVKGLATQVEFYKSWILFGESQGSLVFLNAETGLYAMSFNTGRGIFAQPKVDAPLSEIFAVSNEAYVYKFDISKNKSAFPWIK
ncbi:MAG: PQQ-binding-like beta-propeller repeat protein [Bdellovibrionales bacterium]